MSDASTPAETATAVREWPVVFSAPMVRAILDGRKMQRRFPVLAANSTVLGYPARRYWPKLLFNHAVPRDKASIMVVMLGHAAAPPDIHLSVPFCDPDAPIEEDIGDLPWYRVRPVWEPGDRLWVQEVFSDPLPLDVECKNFTGFLRATDPHRKVKWRPASHMPRWASRITLEVTGVRVERLQEIGEDDAAAEGASSALQSRDGRAFDIDEKAWCAATRRVDPEATVVTARGAFAALWDRVNGKRPERAWAANPWVWVVEFKRL